MLCTGWCSWQRSGLGCIQAWVDGEETMQKYRGLTAEDSLGAQPLWQKPGGHVRAAGLDLLEGAGPTGPKERWRMTGGSVLE
jgi:hypothetical protein